MADPLTARIEQEQEHEDLTRVDTMGNSNDNRTASEDDMTSTAMTPDQARPEVEANRKMAHAAFVKSLREFADFIEQHPDVKIPIGTTGFNVFVDSRDELAAHARVTSWEKHFDGDYFWLRKIFGAVSLDVNCNRGLICRRIVTGTRVEPAREVEIVEWVCDDPAVLR